jgi:hypothetical protein
MEGLEGGGGEAGAWGVMWGPALVPELEEQQGNKRGASEESKSQLEGVWGLFCFILFCFFKWKQDYGTLSPTEGILHLLLGDWALVVYMLN